MTSKVLFVLLLACTAVLSASPKAPLQKRADGLISNLIGFGGDLTKSAVDKLVSGGHATMSMLNGMINYGADTMKSVSNTLLRRDLGYTGPIVPPTGMGYNTISNMIGKAQTDLDQSWRAANQLARNMRPNLSERGQDVLDLYMKELRTSRNSYGAALRNAAANAADLNSRLDTSSLATDQDLWSLVQDNYSVEMVDYATQARRLGNVIANNGLDL